MNIGKPLEEGSAPPPGADEGQWNGTECLPGDSRSVAPQRRDSRCSRVLVDISYALWDRAGIPQAARQLVSILSSAPGVDVSAFILSIHDKTAADRLRGKTGHFQSAVEDAEFLADALGQHQEKKKSGPVSYVRKYAKRLVNPPYPLIPIKKGLYDDVIWENYFAPGLGASRRDLLPLVSFFRSSLTYREIARRLRKKKPLAVLNTSGFDFVVFQKPSPVRVSPGTVKIIRCHDLVPLLRFDTQPASHQLMRDFHTALAQNVKDSYFACVSEATREELLSFCPDIAAKAFVIPNSVTFSASAAGTKTTARTTESYFLAVGTIEPRKNYRRLIDAFRTYRLTQSHLPRLVLVGNPGWRNEKELGEIARAVEEGWLEWYREVSPDRLVELYRDAYALICSSVHEGFGIPPVEAASLGVPSVLSDLAVFRAHFGDAAEYFDPYDHTSMVEALGRLNPARRSQLQNKVVQKARRFGPEQELTLWQELFSRLGTKRKQF